MRAERFIAKAVAALFCSCAALTAFSACGGSSFESDAIGAGGAPGDAGAGKGGGAGKAGGSPGSGGGSSGSGTGGSGTGGSGTGGSSGGPSGEPCGDTLCGPDEYCCNPSCGTCTLLGTSCPEGCGDAGPPEPCGGGTCPSGRVCCGDESCGYCVGPLDPCAQPICTDPDPRRCGRVRCAEELECCNASCNTCVPPGGGCAAIVCAPDCAAMDATAAGACAAELGVVWTGSECVPLSGCECVGADCPNLFLDAEECARVFGSCI